MDKISRSARAKFLRLRARNRGSDESWEFSLTAYPCSVNQSAPPPKKFWGGPFHISVWNFCVTSNGKVKWHPPKFWGKRFCPILSFTGSRGGKAVFFSLAHFCFSIASRCPLNDLKVCTNIFEVNRIFSKSLHTFKVKIKNFPLAKKTNSKFTVFFYKRKNLNLNIKRK